jgi:prepilin-type N-terminal cleavage/methylation domain-containing protein
MIFSVSRKTAACLSGRAQKGMTLIELLVSMTIGIILLTSAWSFFLKQGDSFMEQRQLAEMQQELRWASQFLSDHVKLAGNAFPPTSGWQVINNTDGSSGAPDSLTILGSFKSLIAVTAENMASATAAVKPDSIQKFETGNLVVLSDGTFLDLFLVTNITGGRLVHDTSLPWNADNSLDHIYGTGSTLTVIDQFNFYLKTDGAGHPNLMLRTQAYPEQLLAGDIDQFQVRFKMKSDLWQDTVVANEVYDVRQIEITLRARSPQPLRNYRDPVYGDAYKRLELKTLIIPKNISIV